MCCSDWTIEPYGERLRSLALILQRWPARGNLGLSLIQGEPPHRGVALALVAVIAVALVHHTVDREGSPPNPARLRAWSVCTALQTKVHLPSPMKPPLLLLLRD